MEQDLPLIALDAEILDSGSYMIQIDGSGENIHIAEVYGLDEDGAIQNAQFIVKACNNFPKLVDALEKLIDLHNYQENEGPKPTYEQWKTAFESAQQTLNELNKVEP